MKVELEKGVWLADGTGDPPRTLVKESAKEFDNINDALAALAEAREFRPFKNAAIEEDMF